MTIILEDNRIIIGSSSHVVICSTYYNIEVTLSRLPVWIVESNPPRLQHDSHHVIICMGLLKTCPDARAFLVHALVYHMFLYSTTLGHIYCYHRPSHNP